MSCTGTYTLVTVFKVVVETQMLHRSDPPPVVLGYYLDQDRAIAVGKTKESISHNCVSIPRVTKLSALLCERTKTIHIISEKAELSM
jgi:hypothetical protein